MEIPSLRNRSAGFTKVNEASEDTMRSAHVQELISNARSIGSTKRLLLQFTTRDTQKKACQEFGAPLAVKYSDGTTSDMLPLGQVNKVVSDFVMGSNIRKVLLVVHGFNTDETNFDAICDKYGQEMYEDGVGVIGLYWCGPFEVGKGSLRYFSDTIVEAMSKYWMGWIVNKLRSRIEAGFEPVILYSMSAENATHSAWSLYYLLIAITTNTRPGYTPPALYILAHSMGTRLTVEALRMLVHDRSLTSNFIKRAAPILSGEKNVGAEKDIDKARRRSSSANRTATATDESTPPNAATNDNVNHLYQLLDEMVPVNFLKCLIVKEGDLDIDTFMRYMKYDLDRVGASNFPKVLVYHREDDEALAYSSAIHGLSVGSKAQVGFTRIGNSDSISAVRGQYIDSNELWWSDWSVDGKQYKADPSDYMMGRHLNHSYWQDERFISSIKEIIKQA